MKRVSITSTRLGSIAASSCPRAASLLPTGAARTLTSTSSSSPSSSSLLSSFARRTLPGFPCSGHSVRSRLVLGHAARRGLSSKPEFDPKQVLELLPADLLAIGRRGRGGWRKGLAAAGVIIVVATLPPWCVVPAGHVGLLDFFGDVSETTLAPGFHLKNPLAKCVVFSTKTQRVETTASVPSREGLIVQLEVSALYRVDPSKVQHIYKTLGKDYANVVLLPHFKSIVRELTSAHEAKGLYTSQVRTEISSLLTKQLNEVLKERGIIIDETPINGITMPDRLVQAIEEKLRSEQESERMSWVLQKEEAEAKRKIIEARGIAEFQKIVTQGISEQLLRWKGIEATEKLATSKNAKMVVIGKADGLPLVLAP